MTRVSDQLAAPARSTQPLLTLTAASAATGAAASAAAPPVDAHPNVVPLSRIPTSGLANGGGADGGGARPAAKRDEIVPLTADIRRVHFNVGKRVVQKLEAARDGLSHAIPGATMEQVLEAALDLLLERQAKARGQVKKPRTTLTEAAPRAMKPVIDTMAPPLEDPTPTDGQRTGPGNCSAARPEGRAIDPPTAEPPPPRRNGPREPIPAAVRRAVWDRDGRRCTWPLDGGGCCGSTHRLELDHIIPWAEWGPSTAENLRIVCDRHNAFAARRAFGERQMSRYAGGRARAGIQRLGRV